MTRFFWIAIMAALGAALPLARITAQSAQPPSKAVLAARLDSMAQAYLAEKQPASMSLVISRNGETLVERAWGLADVAANRPATTASIYRIGTVSKQFTAVLLLKQVERGKLALTDSIGHYLTTGLRPEWRPLTIEQLLNHTGGLPFDFEQEGSNEDEVPTETLIAWAVRDTMTFAPGTDFAYSNVGYLLLGALVEKLYDKPYAAALREEIARPLGLRTLGWCPEKEALVTTGYNYDGPGKHQPSPYVHPSRSLGWGGLCATTADLAAWNQALHGGRVLSPALYAAMTTPRGAAPRYGFGLQVGLTPWDAQVIYHFGSEGMFTAENAWFPDESLSVTILYNSFGPANGFPTVNFIVDLSQAASAQLLPSSGQGGER